MAWQSGTINPATTSPATDISKITNDLGVLKARMNGTADADVPTTFADTGAANTFSKPQRGTITTDNDLSFDLTGGTNHFVCTPTGSGTLTFTNLVAGQSGNIILVNGSNYAISKASAVKCSSTMLATISASGTYWLSYHTDGTNVYVANTGALA